MENIALFLDRAKADFGLVHSDLFMAADLYEAHNLKLVVCSNFILILIT